MNREGFTGFSRGEARNRTATSLSFERLGLGGKLARMPWGFVMLIVAMAVVGLMTLYSSAYTNPIEQDLWKLQSVRFAVTFCMMIFMAVLPISFWMRMAFPAYIGTLVLLLGVDLFGFMGGGAKRWLQIGPIGVQPSEFAKLATTLALARYYQMVLGRTNDRLFIHIGALAILMVPAQFIFRQPDFGTTLALIASGAVIIFLAGLMARVIITSIAAGIAAVPAVYYFVLAPYQRERVDTFLAGLFGHATNGLGESYQIEQGKIAIGSGGWNGKGFLQGIQSQQDYVPEQHTDFILTVIAEEFGFIGAAALLTAFAALLGWSFWSAMKSQSWFARLAASGAAATIAFYILFNVSMVIGLLPVVGMPLPLMSYGGTALLTTMACFGIILSAYIHRDEKLTARGFL